MRGIYRKRQIARQLLLQAVYQLSCGGNTFEEIMEQYLQHATMDGADKTFFKDGFNIVGHISDILDRYFQNYCQHEMDLVTLSITRIAVYELFHKADIPQNVILNEAVELAKNFGGSYRYVNAVLDAVSKKSKLAFLFPGQGSQSLNMLSTFQKPEQLQVIQELFGEASSILEVDLYALLQNSDAIHQTKWTQPLMLTASVTLWKMWVQAAGRMPDVVAGHSLGEYSALCCTGAIDFKDAVKLVHERGKLMAEMSPKNSGMAVIIGLTYEQVDALCARINEEQGTHVIQIANYNSPIQIVIAGMKEAIDCALTESIALKAKLARLIPVSVPAHSQWMKPVSEKLQGTIQKISFHQPNVFFASTRSYYTPKAIANGLVTQLYSSINWVAIVDQLKKMGVGKAIECGPGHVLSGLSKELNSQSIDTEEKFFHALEYVS